MRCTETTLHLIFSAARIFVPACRKSNSEKLRIYSQLEVSPRIFRLANNRKLCCAAFAECLRCAKSALDCSGVGLEQAVTATRALIASICGLL